MKTLPKLLGAKFGIHSLTSDTTMTKCGEVGKALFPEDLR